MGRQLDDGDSGLPDSQAGELFMATFAVVGALALLDIEPAVASQPTVAFPLSVEEAQALLRGGAAAPAIGSPVSAAPAASGRCVSGRHRRAGLAGGRLRLRLSAAGPGRRRGGARAVRFRRRCVHQLRRRRPGRLVGAAGDGRRRPFRSRRQSRRGACRQRQSDIAGRRRSRVHARRRHARHSVRLQRGSAGRRRPHRTGLAGQAYVERRRLRRPRRRRRRHGVADGGFAGEYRG